ncbi:MAG TPA: hypothetical protein VHX16_01725, partial [Chloroflexota bacterium]|nr:hypothetical protein [Chloroflexota bacterium]
MIFRFCRVDRLNSSLVVTLALLLLLATPGHPSSLLRGFPLEPIVTSIALPLAFLVWGGRGSPTFPGQRWLIIGIVVIALLKSLLAVGAPEPGALASYFGRARLTDPPERALDFRQLKGATRIDRVLDFDQGSLPVGFFNDNDRFNFYQPGEPDRQRLPLAAVWDGWISVP